MAARKRPADDDGHPIDSQSSVESLCQGVKRLKTNNWSGPGSDPNLQQLNQLQQQQQQRAQQGGGAHLPPRHPHHQHLQQQQLLPFSRAASGDALGPSTPQLEPVESGGLLQQGLLPAETYQQVNLMLRALHFERMQRVP